MNMLAHHHITDQKEAMSRADLIQHFHKTMARTHCAQQWSAPVTTKGDKMKVASSVKTPQSVAHGGKIRPAEKSTPAPLKTKGCGTPVYALLPTRNSTRMIYSRSASKKQQNLCATRLQSAGQRESAFQDDFGAGFAAGVLIARVR